MTTEAGICADMDIEKIHDLRGRGNSTKYLVKLFQRDDLVWINGKNMQRRDLVREFQRTRYKESKLQRQMMSGPRLPMLTDDNQAQPGLMFPAFDNLTDQQQHLPQQQQQHQQPQKPTVNKPRPRSQGSQARNSANQDLRAYFKQFGGTSSGASAEATNGRFMTGLSVANLNAVIGKQATRVTSSKAANKKEPNSKKRKVSDPIGPTANQINLNDGKRQQISANSAPELLASGPSKPIQANLNEASQEEGGAEVDLLYNTPEPLIECNVDPSNNIAIKDLMQSSSDEGSLEQEIPESSPQPDLHNSQLEAHCFICKETDLEKLTGSLCNHAAFCYRCIIHLMMAESRSHCNLCNNMHSSFIKMINPLTLHRLLMACAPYINPNDENCKEWQAYQERKLRDITQSLEAINTLSLMIQTSRIQLQQQIQAQAHHQNQYSQQRHLYPRDFLPNIQNQWMNQQTNNPRYDESSNNES